MPALYNMKSHNRQTAHPRSSPLIRISVHQRSLAVASLLLLAFLILPFEFCIGQSITNIPIATSVMVNSNGVVIAPTNFAAANGLNTNSITPINRGGTGQTNASAALMALGGASLTASNVLSGGQNVTGPLRVTEIMANPGLAGTAMVFDEVGVAGDQSFDFTGNAVSSGNGFTLDILGTNVDGSLATNKNGHVILDQVNVVGVGNGSPYSDFPGTMLFVSPQTQIVFGHNNSPRLVIAGQGSRFTHIGIPYLGAGTNEYPYPETLKNGTNTYSIPSDTGLMLDADVSGGTLNLYAPGGMAIANGTVVSTTNGTLIKSNGKLSNIAFDSADAGAVSLSDAVVTGSNFVATAQNFTSSGKVGFDASGTGSGLTYETAATSGVHMTMLTAQGSVPMTLIGNNGGFIGTFNSMILGGLDSDVTNVLSGGNNNSVVQIMGSLGLKTVTKTSSYALTANDAVVLMNGVTLTATLPDATSHCTGRTYIIKLIASSTCTVATTSSQHIDGATSYTLSAQYKYVYVQSDGTQWWILGNN
jgi:hypothetical protein